MKCPACGNTLSPLVSGAITVDVCQEACGGIWFDNFELEKVDEAHEEAGLPLLDIHCQAGYEVDHSKRRECPKCQDVIMMRHFFSVKRSVEVDECAGCGGVWLDAGELAKIREEFATAAERKRITTEHIIKTYNCELSALKAARDLKVEKAQNFARLFKFICPSYWIPGKQEGAAF